MADAANRKGDTEQYNLHFQNCLAQFKEAAASEPHSIAPLREAAKCCLQMGLSSEAFQFIGNALTRNPSDPECAFMAACIIQQKGDIMPALSKYRISIFHIPEHPFIWNNIGMGYYGLCRQNESNPSVCKGHSLRALGCLFKASTLAPLNWRIRYNLGLVCLFCERDVDAFRQLSAAIGLKPNHPALLMLFGIAVSRLGDHKNANNAFRRSISMSDCALVRINYAIVCLRAKRNSEANSMLSKATGSLMDEKGEYIYDDREMREKISLLLKNFIYMLTSLKITVVVDNCVKKSGLLAEHGLSFWIESDHGNILFDTGQGLAFKNNVKKLKIHLSDTSAIVLSHGHYDHTGGLSYALSQIKSPQIYFHPTAIEEKWSTSRGHLHSIAIPAEVRSKLLAHKIGWHTQRSVSEIIPGIYCTGEIPREIPDEADTSTFFKDKDCRIIDDVMDDQALYCVSPRGLIIILGCCHSGLSNTISYIQKITTCHHIFAIIGGTHLKHHDISRISSIKSLLKDVDIIGMNHCTDHTICSEIRKAFPSQVVDCSAGSEIILDYSQPVDGRSAAPLHATHDSILTVSDLSMNESSAPR
ncbi:MBL fold metallo-hydrolase [Aduncisulcus paluster]|uniref:MBL fold metallo-hydrolase n=1 Tax=Aduncisulcus paluster TaxID=2918883 RepID=A0ABQ5KWJ7_9EUKA|nr:MBL fold metallo-hydrolase [Aduncisulcus paluster]